MKQGVMCARCPRQPARRPWRLWAGLGLALFSAGAARADLAGDIALAVEQSLNRLSGTEVQIASTINVQGFDITLNLIGFAFCLPPDPAAAPNPAPTPPGNAYGCTNAAQVQVTVQPDLSGGTMTVAIGTLFVDLETARDRTLFCGEFNPGTVERPGYVVTDGIFHAGFTLPAQDGCRQLQVGAVTSDIGPFDWSFGDDCLNNQEALREIVLSYFASLLDPYFEQVLAVAVADANEEICALTRSIGWCNLQWPPTLTAEAGVPGDLVYGQVWSEGLTNQPGAAPGLVAQVGYGPVGSNPSSDPSAWQWTAATYNLEVGNNDEYMAQLTVPVSGTFHYAYRYAYGAGAWCYGDLDGSQNGYAPDQAGVLTVSGATEAPVPRPYALRLHAGAPNPFNPRTTIRFELPAEGAIRLEIRDVAGRLVRLLIDAELPAGAHAADWDGCDHGGLPCASGVYLVRLSTPQGERAGKVNLAK